MERILDTARLQLRQFTASDAERMHEIKSNWNVIRMLRLAPYPSTLDNCREWIAQISGEWERGEAYRFAVVHKNTMIGCTDIDELREGRGELGYWFDQMSWGRGFASEAAEAVVAFAFDELGLTLIESGHASDNPASGHILEKLGFRRIGESTIWSNPRGAEIEQYSYALHREKWDRQ
ncbi:MAG: GNAT family N-acetyltransferase [Parvibaculum sp.]|uniref:GNAT family N-acetyltransferase n=1 Tax=Parvibaculum sp. TaxID=2024848 RepID=UPI002716B0F1|nr:GNAT family N-acetyltransferase [Parvibaculum sp.]MDO8837785.1 GNAT family N-acetyltransferase [Parvibaculum sp.]